MKTIKIVLEMYDGNEDDDYFAGISDTLAFEWGTVIDIEEEDDED